MKILICGGRNFDNWGLFNESMRVVLEKHDLDHQKVFETREIVVSIIHGDAKGADFCARLWAILWGLPEVRFPANWKDFGKAAGSKRNQQMLDEGQPDLVIAFPGGTGTADMVRRANMAGVPVEVIKE
jgi:hypothetical protein